MGTNINLVRQREKKASKLKKNEIYSLSFFGVCFVIAAGLLLYNLTLKNTSSSLEEEIVRTKQSTRTLSEVKVKILTVKERLSQIQNILSSRNDVNVKLIKITEAVPTSVAITNLQSTHSSVVLQLSSSDLASINNYLEQEINEFARAPENDIARVDLGSMEFDSEGLVYTLTVNIYFKGS